MKLFDAVSFVVYSRRILRALAVLGVSLMGNSGAGQNLSKTTLPKYLNQLPISVAAPQEGRKSVETEGTFIVIPDTELVPEFILMPCDTMQIEQTLHVDGSPSRVLDSRKMITEYMWDFDCCCSDTSWAFVADAVGILQTHRYSQPGVFHVVLRIKDNSDPPNYAYCDHSIVVEMKDEPLPVQAISFKSTPEAGAIVLEWETQSEVNNAGFNLLRTSVGGESFGMISSCRTDRNLEGLGTSTTGRSYRFVDSPIEPGFTYRYKLQSVSLAGDMRDVGILQTTSATQAGYVLYQNYPNPFNPRTTIRFILGRTSSVMVQVYGIQGQTVFIKSLGPMKAGSHEIELDISELQSGVYFYRPVAGPYRQTRKLILIK